MEAVPGQPHTYHLLDPAFDTAQGNALCNLLRRDPRVLRASHHTDYTTMKLVLETIPGADVRVVLADAATRISKVFEAMASELELESARGE
jgi:hypothetical protein